VAAPVSSVAYRPARRFYRQNARRAEMNL